MQINKYIQYILVVLLTSSALLSIGQSKKTHFTKLDYSDGLPHSHVYKVVEDKEGYIWICTHFGLGKYDGKNFVQYYTEKEDSNNISNNVIYDFFESTDGTYYVGTDNGFNILDRKMGRFKSFFNNPADSNSLSHNKIADIGELQNGIIVLATGKGVDFFDPKTESFKHYGHEKFSHDDFTPRLLIDDNQQILIGSTNGLYQFVEGKNTLDFYPLKMESNIDISIRAVIQDSSGTIWLGTTNGLYIFDTAKKQFERVNFSSNNNANTINSLLEYKQGYLYIATRDGLYYLDIEKREIIKHFAYSEDNPEGITINYVFSLMKDRHFNLWMGLYRGVNIINEEYEFYKIYSNQGGINNMENAVRRLFIDSKDRVWMSTFAGLRLKQTIDGNAIPIKYLAQDFSETEVLNSFVEDGNGDVWLFFKNGPLFKCEVKKNEVNLIKKFDDFKGFKVIRAIVNNSDSTTFWIATTGGICNYNSITNDTFWIYPNALSAELISNSVKNIIQHENGTIYFVSNNRLAAYNPYDTTTKVFKTDPNDPNAWHSGIAYNMDIVNDKIYLSRHLTYFDIKREVFVNLRNSTRFLKFEAASVLAVSDEEIWLSGPRFLRSYNPIDSTLKTYNLSEQLNGAFFNKAGFKSKAGKLYFGASDGVVVVDPKNIVVDSIKDRIVFSKFLVANEERDFKIENEIVESIELLYNEKVFTIEYTALNFTNQQNINYRYKLVGFDKKWLDAGAKREVTYTNLPPKKYTFLVEAVNVDGIPSSNTLSINIVIKPPFWKTNWFYATIVGIICLIMYLIFLNWKRTEKLKQERQLADQKALYKTKFLTNMSHELRTPMNAIMGLNTLMLGSELNEKQKEYTKAIHLSCENLLWIINDILDQAKIESGKLKIKSEPFNIKAVIDQVKLLLINKIQEKDLRFILKLDEAIPESVIGDPIRIFQVLTNLIGNAIKFTDKGSITLSVTQQETNNETAHLLFEVEDTGIGIQKDQLESIFKSFEQVGSTTTKNFGNQGTGLGLSIAKELVELMGGEIKVESEFNQGSKFYFMLPFQIAKETLKNEKTEQQSIPEGLKILLVEDTPMNQFVAVELLQKHLKNPIIEKANNGKEALDKIESKSYDLVLMDIKMPIMDGLEATKLIRAKGEDYYKNIPILGLTANAIPQQIEACFNAGMNECVTKPINIDELINKISAVIYTNN